MVDSANKQNVGGVRDFYNGANVLISGGTGFIGHVLVEHLLRKTDVNSIYIIARAKKGQSIEERAKNYFNNVLFTLLKEQKIDALDKVKFISGCIEDENLGLSEENRTFLVENTNIVFHIAATTAFNENLKKAISINIGGTKAMLDLAVNLKNLKAFVYTSTAFVNGNIMEDYISQEKVMPKDGELGPLEVIQMGQFIDKNAADKITPAFTENTMNTYFFTKRRAEALVNMYKHLPIGIFRPAVVLSTKSEPFPGWIDTIYGPSGLTVARGSGLIHLSLSHPKSGCDIVPVDMTANGMIVSAWDIHNRQNGLNNGEMGIYNYVTSPDNQMTWKKLQELVQVNFDKYPPPNRFWHSFLLNAPNPTLYIILSFFLQYIPAAIYDKIVSYKGGIPRMVKTVKKLDQLNYFYGFITCKDWKYINDNVHGLWDRMDPSEKLIFPFNLKKLTWESYIENYVQGIHTYLLKTSYHKLEEAKTTALKYFWLHWSIVLSSFVFCIWVYKSIFL